MFVLNLNNIDSILFRKKSDQKNTLFTGYGTVKLNKQ